MASKWKSIKKDTQPADREGYLSIPETKPKRRRKIDAVLLKVITDHTTDSENPQGSHK